MAKFVYTTDAYEPVEIEADEVQISKGGHLIFKKYAETYVVIVHAVDDGYWIKVNLIESDKDA